LKQCKFWRHVFWRCKFW